MAAEAALDEVLIRFRALKLRRVIARAAAGDTPLTQNRETGASRRGACRKRRALGHNQEVIFDTGTIDRRKLRPIGTNERCARPPRW